MLAVLALASAACGSDSPGSSGAAGGGGGGAGGGGSGGTAGTGGTAGAASGGTAGAAPDASADSGPACDSTAPFVAVTRLDEWSTPARDASIRFSSDELSVYVARFVSGDAGSEADLFQATRPSTGDAFGPLEPIASVNSAAHESHPTVTPDGLELFFEYRPASGTNAIFVASRSSTSESFGIPAKAANVNVGTDTIHPYVVAGGEALYFATASPSMIQRAAHAASGFAAPQPLPELGAPVSDAAPSDAAYPVVTGDEKTIYFASSRDSTSVDVWIATRPSASAQFSTPAKVELLSSDFEDRPSWVSQDGCRLYLTAARADTTGDLDVYLAVK